MANRSRLQDIVMRITIALIGGALLVACASLSKLPAVEKTKSATLSSSNVLPQPSPSQASQADEESALEKIPLRKAFLEKLKQVPNPEDREQYIGAIYELNRLSKKDLKNKAILETLVQNQEKLLPILQTCGFKHWNGLSSFQSIALYQSKFWKLSNGKHLIQLVCGTGAYNLSFAFFIASELSEKTQFKPLTLTEFYEDKNGRVQRKKLLESAVEPAQTVNLIGKSIILSQLKNYVSGVNILVWGFAALGEYTSYRMISLYYKNSQPILTVNLTTTKAIIIVTRHFIHNTCGDRSLELIDCLQYNIS